VPIDPEPADAAPAPAPAPAVGHLSGIPPEAARVLADLGIGRLAVEEDQDQVLAWEMEAFPPEDEPIWEDPDAAPDDDDGWLADLPGEVLADYLAATGAEPVGPADLTITGAMASPAADAAPPSVAPPPIAAPLLWRLLPSLRPLLWRPLLSLHPRPPPRTPATALMPAPTGRRGLRMVERRTRWRQARCWSR
jgi:hypothetical protein